MKFDLHVHTTCSSDSILETKDIFEAARLRGIDGVAVTNHDVFEKVARDEGVYVIPACEISTDAGHMLVYFISSDICKSLRKNEKGVFSFPEVVEKVREEGGLIFAAHPFSPEIERAPEVWEAVDGVEIFNSRVAYSRISDANERALALCREKNLAFSAGSDAHSKEEIGTSFWESSLTRENMEKPDFEEMLKRELLSGNGKVFGGYSPRRVLFSCKRKSYIKRKLYKKYVRSFFVSTYLLMRDILKGKKKIGYISWGCDK